LQQVVLNLVVNAQDAMSSSGGRLVVNVSQTERTEPDAKLELEAGPYGVLSVSDSGQGIDEQTRARLFEPFFTTKERGKGTGLGLATVYGIVKQHRGAVTVTSAKGEGATFRVYFPRSGDGVQAARSAPPSVPGRGETVLVAEDDPSVRALVKSVLERNGYRVLAAADGQAALDLAHQEKGRIDLLLSDVIMPRMNGRDLRDVLTVLYPGLRVIFMSGYTGDALSGLGGLDGDVQLVSKPFTPDVLLDGVRKALGL
jgi:CheY-like chemotaxis protein